MACVTIVILLAAFAGPDYYYRFEGVGLCAQRPALRFLKYPDLVQTP